MTNPDMIARLADLREFAELEEYFATKRDEAISALGRKTFSQPQSHDRLEWERLKSYYKGIADVLALPAELRDKKKENG